MSRMTWESCGGLVKCTKCGSDEMEMCDVPIRKTGGIKRETRCLGCEDRQTTKMDPPQLPAPAQEADKPCPGLATLRQAYEEADERAARGEYPAPKPKKGRTKAPVAVPPPVEPRRGPTLELLDLDAIEADSIQPREQLDLFAVSDYANQMRRGDFGQVVDLQGDDWTPLVVYREPGPAGKIRLADGFHRVKAARDAGLVAFQAQVYTGTQRDALYHATGANARHGVRLTNGDKRRVVQLQLDDAEWSKASDTAIAARCGVTQPFVSKMRAEQRERQRAREEQERPREEPKERAPADNGYGEESAPEPLQFDIEETIAARQRRQAEEEEEAAERRAEAERKRIEQEQRDSWSTPPEFLETIVRPILEVIDLDAASNEAAQAVVQATRWISAEEDALTQEWEGRVWLNPPYSHPLVERFAMKAIEEVKSGRVTQLLVLVNSSTSSAWWHALANACAVVAFPLGRISFWSPHGLDGSDNRNSSTVFYFGNRDVFALHHLRRAGYFAAMNTTF